MKAGSSENKGDIHLCYNNKGDIHLYLTAPCQKVIVHRMPRTSRSAPGGIVYHVLNRGNDRKKIFRKQGDYAAFVKLLLEGRNRASVEVFAYCLMPNHWHLVL